MSWQVLILLSSVLLALSMVFMRLLARKTVYSGASFVVNGSSFIFLYLSGLALLPLLGTVRGEDLSHYLWRFIIGGLLFALTNVATYKSLAYVDAATGTIFNTLNVIFAIGMAALTLDENLNSLQAIGTVVLLVAVIYSARVMRSKAAKVSKHDLLIGLSYAVVAALLYGIAITNEKWLLGQMNSASYVVFGWGWQMVSAVVVAILIQPRKLSLLKDKKFTPWIILIGLAKGIGGLAFVLAEVRSNNVALVTVIGNFKIIFVVGFAVWLLRERAKIKQKLFGAGVATLGLIFMFWR